MVEFIKSEDIDYTIEDMMKCIEKSNELIPRTDEWNFEQKKIGDYLKYMINILEIEKSMRIYSRCGMDIV